MDFYSSSARILDQLLDSPSPLPLKTLCTREAKQASPARCYAILAETLKYLPVLDRLIKSVDLLRSESKVLQKKPTPSSRSLALLLTHDLLFNRKGIALPKEHKVRQAVERYGTRLKGNLQREKIKAKVSTNEGLQVAIDEYIMSDRKGKGRADGQDSEDPDDLTGSIRWLRVNENKWTTSEATDWLLDNGWQEQTSLAKLPRDSSRCFCVDEHIPNLLAVPVNSVNLPKFPPYQDGRLIAQDKASCFPAYLLLQGLTAEKSANVTVVDATSAPGNKTSYASATLHRLGGGNVLAFEKDEKRYKVLRSMLSKAGCRNVQATHADFLDCDPTLEPYKSATHILVDPSCSGSGIHDDYDDGSVTEEALQERLRPLSHFQRFILSAALRFPAAERVVYSTCSVHKEEDEDVVFSLLEEEEFKATWQLEDHRRVLPNWPMRGRPDGHEDRSQAEVESLIRCERKLGTHGFFVAVFVRKAAGQAPDVSRMRTWGPEARPETAAPELGENHVPPAMEMSEHAPPSPNFSLLRLATLDRKRRQKIVAIQAIDKLRRQANRHSHSLQRRR